MSEKFYYYSLIIITAFCVVFSAVIYLTYRNFSYDKNTCVRMEALNTIEVSAGSKERSIHFSASYNAIAPELQYATLSSKGSLLKIKLNNIGFEENQSVCSQLLSGEIRNLKPGDYKIQIISTTNDVIVENEFSIL